MRFIRNFSFQKLERICDTCIVLAWVYQSYCKRWLYRRIYQLFTIQFWEMTRQENKLVYLFQLGSVRKKMFRFLYLQMRPLPLFSHVLAEKGYVDNVRVPR